MCHVSQGSRIVINVIKNSNVQTFVVLFLHRVVLFEIYQNMQHTKISSYNNMVHIILRHINSLSESTLVHIPHNQSTVDKIHKID